MLLRVKNFAEENDRPRSRGASRSTFRKVAMLASAGNIISLALPQSKQFL